jgi:hypothetical protein
MTHKELPATIQICGVTLRRRHSYPHITTWDAQIGPLLVRVKIVEGVWRGAVHYPGIVHHCFPTTDPVPLEKLIPEFERMVADVLSELELADDNFKKAKTWVQKNPVPL